MKVVKFAAFFILGCLILVVGMYLMMKLADYSRLREVDEGNTLRCHVFQEVIIPGMTQEDVLKVLDQYGPYDMNRSDFSPGVFRLRITYSDPQTWQMFGSSDIILEFSDNLYSGAWLPYGIGDSLPVCKA
jgi:hypothetical protein